MSNFWIFVLVLPGWLALGLWWYTFWYTFNAIYNSKRKYDRRNRGIRNKKEHERVKD